MLRNLYKCKSECGRLVYAINANQMDNAFIFTIQHYNAGEGILYDKRTGKFYTEIYYDNDIDLEYIDRDVEGFDVFVDPKSVTDISSKIPDIYECINTLEVEILLD